MCKILDKLNELTPNLPAPTLSKYKAVNGSITTYNFESGSAISENIYSIPEIGIAKTFIKGGTTFDIHQHELSGEWIIVLNGELKIYIKSEFQTLYKYDSVKIDAKKPHFAIAIQDTTIIAITIPRDDGFPE